MTVEGAGMTVNVTARPNPKWARFGDRAVLPVAGGAATLCVIRALPENCYANY